jgi:hypothetical protein
VDEASVPELPDVGSFPAFVSEQFRRESRSLRYELGEVLAESDDLKQLPGDRGCREHTLDDVVTEPKQPADARIGVGDLTEEVEKCSPSSVVAPTRRQLAQNAIRCPESVTS